MCIKYTNNERKNYIYKTYAYYHHFIFMFQRFILTIKRKKKNFFFLKIPNWKTSSAVSIALDSAVPVVVVVVVASAIAGRP